MGAEGGGHYWPVSGTPTVVSYDLTLRDRVALLPGDIRWSLANRLARLSCLVAGSHHDRVETRYGDGTTRVFISSADQQVREVCGVCYRETPWRIP